MPVNLSRFEIRVGDRAAFLAYAGHFLADSLTGDVVHLAVHGQDIPGELSLSEISHSFEYERVRIGETHPLITRRSEMYTLGVSRDAFRRPMAIQYRTITVVDSCRRFAAESTVFATDSTVKVESEVTH